MGTDSFQDDSLARHVFQHACMWALFVFGYFVVVIPYFYALFAVTAVVLELVFGRRHRSGRHRRFSSNSPADSAQILQPAQSP